MSQCIVCQSLIPRGQRFKSPRYKNLPFCSESCYNQYLASKQQLKPKPKASSLDKLKAYINDLWQGQVNWPFMMRQIKNLKEECGVSDNDIRMMLKYAVEYEGVKVDLDYGLLQFIQYLQPSQEFAEEIRKNQVLAESMEDDEVEVVKASRGNGKRWMKGDWRFE